MCELIVVLVRTRGPTNLGLVARACSNLDARLRLVQPECEVDQSEARKFANHAKDSLLNAPVFESVSAAVKDCDRVIGTSANRRQRGFIDPLVPADLPSTLKDTRRVAMVFGNEADGLNNEELRACQSTLFLPTFGDYPSYNLSHAVVAGLFSARMQAMPKRAAPSVSMLADQSDLADLARVWLDVLERFGYFRRTDRSRFAPKLNAMLGRLRLADHDAGLLRGMLAHLQEFRLG